MKRYRQDGATGKSFRETPNAIASLTSALNRINALLAEAADINDLSAASEI